MKATSKREESRFNPVELTLTFTDEKSAKSFYALFNSTQINNALKECGATIESYCSDVGEPIRRAMEKSSIDDNEGYFTKMQNALKLEF